jgi:hypothetical protein
MKVLFEQYSINPVSIDTVRYCYPGGEIETGGAFYYYEKNGSTPVAKIETTPKCKPHAVRKLQLTQDAFLPVSGDDDFETIFSDELGKDSFVPVTIPELKDNFSSFMWLHKSSGYRCRAGCFLYVGQERLHGGHYYIEVPPSDGEISEATLVMPYGESEFKRACERFVKQEPSAMQQGAAADDNVLKSQKASRNGGYTIWAVKTNPGRLFDIEIDNNVLNYSPAGTVPVDDIKGNISTFFLEGNKGDTLQFRAISLGPVSDCFDNHTLSRDENTTDSKVERMSTCWDLKSSVMGNLKEGEYAIPNLCALNVALQLKDEGNNSQSQVWYHFHHLEYYKHRIL